MKLPIYQVDAFTQEPFKGNPAAVCILSKPKEEEWMLKVAAEMNVSETAFLLKRENGYNLRWFTPEVEVDLCGHATLASAHVLLEEGYIKKEDAVLFYTKSGLLSAKLEGDWIILDFPAEPANKCEAPLDLVEALGVEPTYIGKNRFEYLVEVDSENVVKNITPDLEKLKRFKSRGVIVTSISKSKEYDFVSRFFAPGIGIDEDPVTGSTHCCLGPYWYEKLGKEEMLGYQASKRGGYVKVSLKGDRVVLAGKAITILKGELLE